MSVHPLSEQFSTAHNAKTISSRLRSFREDVLADHKPGTFALRRTHNNIVMLGQSDNFETNWEYGRTLDKAGRPRDALAYIKKAQELDPTHTKVTARLVEILLELHEEMPNRGYNHEAHGFACTLISLEVSDFSNNLYEAVQKSTAPTHEAPALIAAE